MCDTLVYRHGAYTLFAKNSDREPNEAQEILHLPEMDHEASTLQCTYIEIPQVSYTYEVLLSKPFHMWGAEMGVNQHGVVIGNEAVFTKVKEPKSDLGLTGMDMIRLALERSRSADEARTLIIDLIQSYGQDANGGYQQRFYYHNSYLIADANEAFKLESAGVHWVWKKIKDGDSISNGLTITTDYDGISDQAIAYANERGWVSKKSKKFSFLNAYREPIYTYLTHGAARRSYTYECVHDTANMDIHDAIHILQSHNGITPFSTHKANASCVCMHPTSLLNPSQTNGSMIVKLVKGQEPEIWITGTSMPCLSVYKPWRLGEHIDIGTMPTSGLDESLWWQAEQVHRLICKDYPRMIKVHAKVFEGWQEELITQTSTLTCQEVWDSYRQRLDLLLSELSTATIRQRSKNPLYRHYNRKINEAVGLS